MILIKLIKWIFTVLVAILLIAFIAPGIYSFNVQPFSAETISNINNIRDARNELLPLVITAKKHKITPHSKELSLKYDMLAGVANGFLDSAVFSIKNNSYSQLSSRDAWLKIKSDSDALQTFIYDHKFVTSSVQINRSVASGNYDSNTFVAVMGLAMEYWKEAASQRNVQLNGIISQIEKDRWQSWHLLK